MRLNKILLLILATPLLFISCEEDPVSADSETELNISVNDLDFSTTPVGESTDEFFTITNDGDVSINDLTLSVGTEHFELSTTNLTLDPRQWTDIQVIFRPQGEGSFNDVLTISSDQNDIEETITLSGTGEAIIDLVPSLDELNFSTTPGESQSLDLEIMNNSNIDLPNIQLSVSGSVFTPGSTSVSINQGESAVVSITYSSAEAGQFQEELTISPEGRPESVTVVLNGVTE